ncbi:ribbon-helix-helix domain-containing protein [Bradyrhizobium sp. URHC0002]
MKSNRRPYNPEPETPFIGFKLPLQQLTELDAARLKLGQGRSQFMRDALRSYLYACRLDTSGTLQD